MTTFELSMPPHLAELLQAATERALGEAEQAELNALLLSGRGARDAYRRYLDVHLGLQLLHAPEALALPSGLEQAPARSRPLPALLVRRWWTVSIVAAVAALVLVAVGAWYASMGTDATYRTEGGRVRVYIARVTFSDGAKWAAESTVLQENEWLTEGTVALQTGRMEITFDSGAILLLSGPAQVNLISASEARLLHGAARVLVPEPAQGFLLYTPQGVVEDLGTEFAVEVDSARQTDVHVIRGAVRATLKQDGSPRRTKRLEERQAVRLDETAGTFAPISFSVAPTLALPDRLTPVPPPCLHYNFDEAQGATVRDTGTFATPYDGRLLNTRTDGAPPHRVAGKHGQALLFDENMAVVETSYPGIGGNRARTVAFWVKIDPDADPESAYSIVTWGLGEKGRRWQIGWNHNPKYGTIGAVRTDFCGGYVTGSTDLRDGRWHHVVSLFIGGKYADVATHVRHYIDGRLEDVSHSLRQRIDTDLVHQKSMPLILGRKVDYERHAPGTYRTFQGALDEVYIFDGALEPCQIVDLMQRNEP